MDDIVALFVFLASQFSNSCCLIYLSDDPNLPVEGLKFPARFLVAILASASLIADRC